MSSQKGEITPTKDVKESYLKAILAKLRKRHIIETLAAFVAGGWLLIEVVERLLVGHYRFPDETIDITVVSVIGALLSTIIWRWFRGTEKRPGNVKVEVLLVPLLGFRGRLRAERRDRGSPKVAGARFKHRLY